MSLARQEYAFRYVPGGFGPGSDRGTLFHRVTWWLGVAALPVGVALLIHGFLPHSAVPGAVGLLASLFAPLAIQPSILHEVAAAQANRLAAELGLSLPRPQAGQQPGLGAVAVLVLAVMCGQLMQVVMQVAAWRGWDITARLHAKVGAPALTIHPRLTASLVAGIATFSERSRPGILAV